MEKYSQLLHNIMLPKCYWYKNDISEIIVKDKKIAQIFASRTTVDNKLSRFSFCQGLTWVLHYF